MKVKLGGILLALSATAFAQNEDDALRYSQTFFGGSARSVSVAGSFGAVGGDYSAVSTNPAGLARFRKQNISFSQAIEIPSSNTLFADNTTGTAYGTYKISNLSYIKAYNLDPEKFNNWYGVQLGLGYNRLHSFEERMRYSGLSDSSILHSFIKRANGVSPDYIYSVFPFDAGLAYDTYALDPGPGNTYVTDFTSGQALHNRSVYRSGGLGEYSFTLSGNYANKLLIGGALNFTRLRYHENYEHRESFTDSALWIQSIRYLHDLEIEGWGAGLRIGAIYMPKEWLRIGLSVQTPTFYRNTDKWTANMFTQTDDGLKYVSEEWVPRGEYDYNVQTPLRANLNLGLVSSKRGSIGLDIEYVDHSTSVLSDKRFSEAPYSFLNENTQVKNLYRAVVNLRVGSEIRLTSQDYLRLGYARYNSAFKPDKGNTLHPIHIFTGGYGHNFGLFYIDAAVMTRFNTANYYAYDPTISGSHSQVKFLNTSLLISAGLRFE